MLYNGSCPSPLPSPWSKKTFKNHLLFSFPSPFTFIMVEENLQNHFLRCTRMTLFPPSLPSPWLRKIFKNHLLRCSRFRTHANCQILAALRSVQHKCRTWSDNLVILPHLPHLVFLPFSAPASGKKFLAHQDLVEKGHVFQTG